MQEAGDSGAQLWGDPQDKGSGGLHWAAGQARTHLLRALSRFSRIWGSSPFRTVVFTNSSPVGVLMNWSSVRLHQRTAGVTPGPPISRLLRLPAPYVRVPSPTGREEGHTPVSEQPQAAEAWCSTGCGPS